MLFQSQAVKLVSDALKNAINNADAKRKARAAKQFCYYSNEQVNYIKTEILSRRASPEKLLPVFTNVVKKIVNALASVYIQAAARRIEGTENDQAIFTEIELSSSLDIQMKMANRLSKLMGVVLLRPIWRNGQMALDVLPADVIDVDWLDTPANLTEVVVTHNDPDGQASSVTYSRWTPEIFQRFDYRGGLIEEQPNPYSVLPFVACWSSPPVDDFWLAGAEDLITVQDGINLLLSNLLYTSESQTFSLLYTKGVQGSDLRDGGLAVGPGVVLSLPKDGDIGYANPNAPLGDVLNAVEHLMRQAAICNGLSAASVSLEPTQESGTSKIVGNSELTELRQDDIALFSKYEDQLFSLFKIIWNAHNPGRSFSKSARLWVDFYDPTPYQSPYEQAGSWERLLNLQVISPVDILMERNPDLDRPQAIKLLEQVQEEIKRFSDPIFPSLNDFSYPADPA